jgi:hypothetical protein
MHLTRPLDSESAFRFLLPNFYFSLFPAVSFIEWLGRLMGGEDLRSPS